MLRLVLGLVATMALLYFGYVRLGARPDGKGPAVSAPQAQARKIVGDYQRIEGSNRAAMEKTLEQAQGTR
jgi:hypothetical protein